MMAVEIDKDCYKIAVWKAVDGDSSQYQYLGTNEFTSLDEVLENTGLKIIEVWKPYGIAIRFSRMYRKV